MSKLKDVLNELDSIRRDEQDAHFRSQQVPHTELELANIQKGFKARRAALPVKADAALREQRAELQRIYKSLQQAGADAAESSANRWDSTRLITERDHARQMVKAAVDGASIIMGETKASKIQELMKKADRSDAHAKRAMLEAISEMIPSLAKGDDITPMLDISHRVNAEKTKLTQTEKEREVLAAESELTGEIREYTEDVQMVTSSMPDTLTTETFFAGQKPLYRDLLSGITLKRDGINVEVTLDDSWGESPQAPQKELPMPTFTGEGDDRPFIP